VDDSGHYDASDSTDQLATSQIDFETPKALQGPFLSTEQNKDHHGLTQFRQAAQNVINVVRLTPHPSTTEKGNTAKDSSDSAAAKSRLLLGRVSSYTG